MSPRPGSYFEMTMLFLSFDSSYSVEWVLFDNKLAGTIPSEVGLMANLELFGVGGNSLNGTLPTEIGVLSNLQVLGICCGNSLTGSVPTALAYLPNISKLAAPQCLCVASLHSSSNTSALINLFVCLLPRNY